MTILEDFEANHEVVLERLRKIHTEHYIDVITRLLPLQIDVTTPDGPAWSEAELADVVRQARAALDRIEDGRSSLIELEAVLVGETIPTGDADRINGDLR